MLLVLMLPVLSFGSEAVKRLFEEEQVLAEQGNARAQYFLGLMYNEGKGVPKDQKEAFKWYRLAADQGDASAQYNLALMYGNGVGVPKDDK
tara:strand:- start:23 stop:295 length:273 start_codon:yes stop_codon:yes gene_type:complete